MSDLISRQDAIDSWDKLSKRGRTEFDQVLMTLPSAPDSRQRGEWERVSADKYVQHAHHFYRCDKCGYDHIGKTNFCHNCGARMKGGDTE